MNNEYRENGLQRGSLTLIDRSALSPLALFGESPMAIASWASARS